LKLHKLDLRVAEREVIGRQLDPDEWDSFTEKEREIKSDQILQHVKKRLQKRFEEDGEW
jgi:hypothetical protein